MKKLGPRKETCLAWGHTINPYWSKTKGPHTNQPSKRCNSLCYPLNESFWVRMTISKKDLVKRNIP